MIPKITKTLNWIKKLSIKKDKNNQIENLNSENETLKKQLEALTKQNEELTLINHNYQVTVSTILSQGMSNDNVEQNEQEPVQKIR